MHRSPVAFVIIALVALPAAGRGAVLLATPSDYQSRIKDLKPGDTLELAAGTYTQGLSITGQNGAADAWITVRGPATGAPATFVAKAGRNTIEIKNSSYVAIQHLTVDAKHKAGLFGLSAKDGASNLVHHVRVEDCAFINHDGSQQTSAISTKTPTWAWEIRRNVIRDAGTGMYLGNSDGSQPFIGGVIENNLVVDPLGYCIQVKYQKPRPDHPGIPTGVSQTLIRHNVLIKNDKEGPDGVRTNLLVGGFPGSGPGKDDLYQIYGNFIFNNPFDALIQASGRVVIHDNILVGAANTALVLRDHDLPLKVARVYNNTIYGGAKGISVGNTPAVSQVVGNLIFAKTGISGNIADKRANLVASADQASSYVVAPSLTLGKMSFYPLPGKCEGPAIDSTVMQTDADHDRDFDGNLKGAWTFRGAYAASDAGPRWALGETIKEIKDSAPVDTADAASDAADAGAGPRPNADTVADAAGAAAADDASSGGGGCSAGGARGGGGLGWLLLGGLGLCLTARGRVLRPRLCRGVQSGPRGPGAAVLRAGHRGRGAGRLAAADPDRPCPLPLRRARLGPVHGHVARGRRPGGAAGQRDHRRRDGQHPAGRGQLL